MSTFFINYAEANVVCLVIFGIMLFHDVLNVDRQEKQIKYDHALIAFMAYFISDSLWAAVVTGVIPKNTFTVLLVNFLNYVILDIVTYMWLRYVMAVDQLPQREKRTNKICLQIPFMVSLLALIVVYLVAPHLLIDEAFELQPLYNVMLALVPILYIGVVVVFSVRKARKEASPLDRRKILVAGFFPVIVIIGGVLQIAILPEAPIFCFSCTIMMLVFYIKSMEDRVSADPLTNLNNRGQLLRFISQEGSGSKEGKKSFVVMIDVNDFKAINDNYGHAEGDRALVIVADALRTVAGRQTNPIFLCRYGGDEFLMVVQAPEEKDIDLLTAQIREVIENTCREKDSPYLLSVGVGYDEFLGKGDSFQRCMQRADKELYLDKDRLKAQGKTTVFLKEPLV